MHGRFVLVTTYHTQPIHFFYIDMYTRCLYDVGATERVQLF